MSRFFARASWLGAVLLTASVMALAPVTQTIIFAIARDDLSSDNKRVYDASNGIYFVGGSDCLPTPGAPINPGTVSNGTGAPSEDYTRVVYNGKTVNKRTVEMMKNAESKLGGKPLMLTQGSYNAGGVGASKGTHDGGGAIDINIGGVTKEGILAIVKALREVGFAAWERGIDGDGFEAHIHAIAIGDAELAPEAKGQVTAYFAGKNGLANRKEDPHKDIGRPIPEWAKQFGSGTEAGTTTPTPTTVCCPTGTGGGGTTADLSQLEKEPGKYVFVFLIGKGLTAEQASGVLANLMAESGNPEDPNSINPNAVNSSSGAYGIAQWMGNRKSKLQAQEDYDKITVQTQHLWDELSGDYKGSVLDPIKAASTREQATRIFLEHFEVPCSPPGRACDGYFNDRKGNADVVYSKFSGMSGSAVASISAGASCPQSGSAVNIDGYTWPLLIPNKKDMHNGYPLPCTKCHHDGTPAFDLANKGYGDPANVGTVAVAITRGKITQVKVDTRNGGCSSIHFLGDDGYSYWYGHTLVNESTPQIGTVVEAGTPISKIGPPRCNNGKAAHLHIDRGSPKGKTGGEECCRDAGFIELMNNLYSKIPDEGVSPL